jgi:hypothetical protein
MAVDAEKSPNRHESTKERRQKEGDGGFFSNYAVRTHSSYFALPLVELCADVARSESLPSRMDGHGCSWPSLSWPPADLALLCR